MRKFLVSLFAFAAFSNPTLAINTYKHWDGSEKFSNFGCGGASTFGQVITIPQGMTHLTKFTFWWTNAQGLGPMAVRGEVYAWHAHKAVGNSLYESEPRTIAFDDDLFHKERFAPAGLAVTPGEQYVIFASIDKDYEQCINLYALGWGWIDQDIYPGGEFVWQDNRGDEQRWTTKPWKIGVGDLAFKAVLTP